MTTPRVAIGFLTLSCLALAGCGLLQLRSDDPLPEPDSVSEVDSEAQLLEPAPVELPVLPPLRRVSRPVDAPWLLDPINVSFRDEVANEAVALVTRGRAVRFDLRLPHIPHISYASASDHTIQDALHAIAVQADWSYEFVNGIIHVQDLETRTLLLLAQPGTVASTLSVNALDSGSGGGDSDGGSVDYTSDPYRVELEPLVNELLAADLALEVPVTAKLLPDANALLVTARPSTVRRIAEVVDTYNGRVSQSVRIHITVYEVQSTSEQSIGSRLQAVAENGTGLFVGGWSLRPVEPEKHTQFAFEVLNPLSRYAGTDVLLEWLNREGDATINFNDSIEVRNNQIAASSSTRTYQYISSITRQQDALGREQTEVQREQLRTGWSITVHPTIGHDAVTVRLALARRSLVEERPFQFGESVGTNFVTDDQVRAMTISLPDGASRIVTALQATDERNNKNKLAGLVTRRTGLTAKTESVLLMRVELI